ncbi:MAG TPA: DNA translocase FtsK [Caldilineaceae bacterium]|nr:DNA translocase FtsK [Caldilineaceae bacterium]
MAARKSTRKRKQNTDPIDAIINTLSRPEVIGLILVLIAVLTMLSLLTSSTGAVTGAWLAWLRELFGVAVWGFPVVIGALGLWMVIHAVDKMPDMPWQQPLGLAVLFLAGLVGTTLWTGPGTAGGGLIGNLLAESLRQVVGIGVAWAFVTFLTISSLILLTDRLLIDLVQHLWLSLQEMRYRWEEQYYTPEINPPVPLPSGRLPWYRELLDRWQSRWSTDTAPLPPTLPAAENLVRANPTRGVGSALREERRPAPQPKVIGQEPAQAAPQPSVRAATPTKPTEGDVLTPRIVGNNAQEWRLPRVSDMLSDWERRSDSDDLIRDQGRLIQETLALFGVPADFEGAYKGPSVTQYLIKPGYVERTVRGERKRIKVKVSKIAGLANDLALALAAPSVRIEAPIPGTGYVGVEVPNHEGNKVGLKELMESDVFENSKAKLRIALGEDVKGQPIISDMTRMPHLLIAGATGAGKSVCINSIITCLLLTNSPDKLRLLMVDPKMVELSVYNGVPHLLSPVITEVDKAAGVLFWAVKEMERRYSLCSKVGARDLVRYNEYLTKRNEKTLPYIVVIIDEMADLMMAAPEEVEKHICRLAQMARAVGIHLIIATQRPSVDVITGLIKANFPARIAFAVTSQTDSRVILDVPGAERLLGRGDMLFMAPDAGKLERLQGTFLDDEEINRIVRYWKGFRTLAPPPADGAENQPWQSSADPFDAMESASGDDSSTRSPTPSLAAPEPSIPDPRLPTTGLQQAPLFEQIEALKSADERDDLFEEAVRVVKETGRGSVSLLQRRLRIGYNRASRIVDQLEEAGLLGPDQGGSMGRVVYIDGQPLDDIPGAEGDSPETGARSLQNRDMEPRGGSNRADRQASPSDVPPFEDEIDEFEDDASNDKNRPDGRRPRVWM